MATPSTPASTISKCLKFPKPPQVFLQQLVKVSSQSDEQCVLLYGTDTQTLIYDLYIYIYIYIYMYIYIVISIEFCNINLNLFN